MKTERVWVTRSVGVDGRPGVEPLPELLDARKLREELGITRAAAEAIMRCVPSVAIPGLRKSYARREDVRLFLDERTFKSDEVPS
jgi:hypothetical protein